MRSPVGAAALAAIFVILGGSGPARAQAEDVVWVGLGAFDVVQRDDEAAELGIEYRFGHRILDQSFTPVFGGIGPVVGALATSDGGVMGYVGAFGEFSLGERWVVTPVVGIGAYESGDGKDLGGVFEIRSALNIAYRFASGRQVGLALTHISNNDFHDENPGANSALLTYSAPLDRFF